MKQYIYNHFSTFVTNDTAGEVFHLKDNDIITLRCDGRYEHRDHVFSLTKDELKKYFTRIYTIEDENRYDRIFEIAMIAAMQSLISNLKECKISTDMYEVENVTTNAIWFANNLVEKLKDKEF